MAEKDTSRVLDLVIEEFTKVLNIHLALVYVYHNNRTVDDRIRNFSRNNCLCNVAEFSNTRRLYQYSVRCIVNNNLLERLAEISY